MRTETNQPEKTRRCSPRRLATAVVALTLLAAPALAGAAAATIATIKVS